MSARAVRSVLTCLALAAVLGFVVGACVTVTGDSRATRLAAAEPQSAALSGAALSATGADTGAAGADTGAAGTDAGAAADTGNDGADPDAAGADTNAEPSPPASPATGAAEAPTDTANTDTATASAAPGRTVGYISLDDSQAFVQAISEGIRGAAREAGLELIECDASWTRVGVRACATRLAEAGVEGIISFQPFADLTATVCDTIGDVPVVGIVYEQGSCQVSRLEIDQAESGRLAGSELGKLAARRWDCDVKAWVTLGSGADDPIGAARMAGFREGYREHCRMPRTRRSLENSQHYITAQTRFAAFLNDVRGGPIIVAAVSDDAALGALAAARQRGRAGQVWAAGQLAQPNVRRAIACDPHFVASVAHFPERLGARLVPTLVDAVEGREVAPQIEAELEVVTAADDGDVGCDD